MCDFYNVGSKIIAHLEKVDNLVAGKTVMPISCEIDTSNHCQNDCKWCIYKDMLKKNRVNLDLDLFRETIHQLYELGCKSIIFTGGGEPLMNPDFVEMLTYAHSYGFEIGLITNGILLNNIFDYISLFKFIRVSVDAISSESYKKLKGTNAFNKVCDNIRRANTLKKETVIGISMVYEKGMSVEAKNFRYLGEWLDCDYSQVKAIVDNSLEETKKELNDLNPENSENPDNSNSTGLITKRFKSHGNLPCKIAGLIGQVTADGKYYYCCIHRGNDDYLIGDLKETCVYDVIDSRKDFVPDTSICKSCRYMNYAIEYEKVKSKKFTMLRHINFL